MKERLDVALTERKLVRSRSAAADLIKRGKIFINGVEAKKASLQVSQEDQLTISEKELYVGRGGLKLASALDFFEISIQNKTCIDIGSSTGGFTDCLLQRGARKVYAVDVGTKQLDPSLRLNPKVVALEQTDIRNAEIEELCDLAVIDVSFISVTHILDDAIRLTSETADIITLVKPQFEVGKDIIGKDGVVKNIEEQKKALQKILDFGEKIGLTIKKTVESAILGGDGNKEFFIHFSKNND